MLESNLQFFALGMTFMVFVCIAHAFWSNDPYKKIADRLMRVSENIDQIEKGLEKRNPRKRSKANKKSK